MTSPNTATAPQSRLDELMVLVGAELTRAQANYPAFHSGHEGLAVIQEEVDELWDEVKRGKGLRQSAHAGAECIQVAAMALRFLVDICDHDDVVAYLSGKHRHG